MADSSHLPPPRPDETTPRGWLAWMLLIGGFYLVFRWGVLDIYSVPTPSMEGALRVGDVILVSKLHYGPITPQTPLQVPLTHQTLWGTGLKSYSELLQLPTFRLPGFSEIKRNDVVVFRVPWQAEHPVDLRTNYIKRCVAVAGDTLEIRNARVYVNGRPAAAPALLHATYFVQVDVPTNDVGQALYAQGVLDYDQPTGHPAAQFDPATGKYGYVVTCSRSTAEYFSRQPYVQGVQQLPAQGPLPMFPDVADFHSGFARSAVPRNWSLDDYGPLPVPRRGQRLTLNPANAAFYFKIIARHEHNEGVTWQNGMIYQNGRMLTSYTVKQNYYFVLGDNRHNSEDSRFWGFVPEDHVVGKAVVVAFSLNPFTREMRFNRLFSAIN